ncbi:hypothetical protein BJ742DRAFT_683889 [Cladochytrium replicatum]|nr:hypothetical protein BJ742DRAFT_683889 [Cladochytrium replicatum]
MAALRKQMEVLRPIVEQLTYWEIFKASSFVTGGVIFTYVGARVFKMSWPWLIIVLYIVNRAFKRNLKKIRTRARNDVRREIAYRKIKESAESVEWLNLFLQRFWLIYEPHLSTTLTESINLTLALSRPTFLDDLSLSEFTLGSNGPRIESVKSDPTADEDQLVMDWDINFYTVDEDEGVRFGMGGEARNSKIQLVARVGKGIASIPIPVLLTDLELRGVAQIRMKFMTTFPHIKSVEFGFLEDPTLQFNLRPLKGMDLMDTPGLSNFVTDTIMGILRSMLVYPNPMVFDMEAMMGPGEEFDGPVGVLYVTVHEARNLRNKELAGTSDPYARVMIGDKVVAKSKTLSSTLKPFWGETIPVIITRSMLREPKAQSDVMRIEVMDWNNLKADSLMGSTKGLQLTRWIRLLENTGVRTDVAIAPADGDPTSEDPLKAELDRLGSDAEREHLLAEWGSPATSGDMWKRLHESSDGADPTGKAGEVRLELLYYPIFDPAQIAGMLTHQGVNPASAPTLDHESVGSGVLTVTVHQAKDLTGGRGGSLCSVEKEWRVIYKTPVRKRTNSPVWEAKFSVFFSEVSTAKLRFLVSDERDALSAGVGAATAVVRPSDADWVRLEKVKTGRLRLSLKYTPVILDDSLLGGGSRQRRLPLGIARIMVIEAKGLFNAERSTFGKSDPYCKLSLGNVVIGTTEVRDNTLDPKWNEIFYAVVYSRRERLVLDVWDSNDMRLDVPLGKVEIALKDVLDKKAFVLEEEAGEAGSPDDEDMVPTVDVLPPAQGEGGAATGAGSAENVGQRLREATSRNYLRLQADGLKGEGLEDEDDAKDGTPATKKSGATKLLTKGAGTMINVANPLNLAKNVGTALQKAAEVGAGLQGDSKQKGAIHFRVEFFPVVTHGAVALVEKPIAGGLSGKGSLIGLNEKRKEKKAREEKKKLQLEEVEEESAAHGSAPAAPPGELATGIAPGSVLGSQESVAKGEDVSPSSFQSAEDGEKKGADVDEAAERKATIENAGILYLKMHSSNGMEATKDPSYVRYSRNDEKTIFSTRARPSHKWNMGTDVFLRDLVHDVIELDLVVVKKGGKDEVVAGTWRGPARDLVGLSSAELPLTTLEGEATGKSLVVSAGFAPVVLQLDDSEKTDLKGTLYVDILSAKDLEAVDRGGTSDPYCQVFINDRKIKETTVWRQTLNAEFNETCNTLIENRLRSTLTVRVMDFNKVTKHVSLGYVSLQLSKLPPGMVVTETFPLQDAKSGSIYLRLFFDGDDEGGAEGSRPGSRLAGSRLSMGSGGMLNVDQRESGAMRKLTRGLTSSIVGGITGVAQAAVSKRETSGMSAAEIAEIKRAEKGEDFGAGQPVVTKEQLMGKTTMSLSSKKSTPDLKFCKYFAEAGYLRAFAGDVTFTILEGRNFKAVDSGGTSDPYVKMYAFVHGKPKSVYKTAVVKKNNLNPKWTNERHKMTLPPTHIKLVVKDHNTMGSSVDLGELDCDVCDLFARYYKNGPIEPGANIEEWIPLTSGAGELRIGAVLEKNVVIAGGIGALSSSLNSLRGSPIPPEVSISSPVLEPSPSVGSLVTTKASAESIQGGSLNGSKDSLAAGSPDMGDGRSDKSEKGGGLSAFGNRFRSLSAKKKDAA